MFVKCWYTPCTFLVTHKEKKKCKIKISTFSFHNFGKGYQNSWSDFYDRVAVDLVCVHFALLCCVWLLKSCSYLHHMYRTPIWILSLHTQVQVLPYFLIYMYCVGEHLDNPEIGYMYIRIASHRRICGSCWFALCTQHSTPVRSIHGRLWQHSNNHSLKKFVTTEASQCLRPHYEKLFLWSCLILQCMHCH